MIRRNENIDWLINDAPAALGEKGSGFTPSTGTRDSCNWHMIGRLKRAMTSVQRERRLMLVWRRLSPRNQNILAAYYTRRREVVTLGATAAFGAELSRVAFLVEATSSEELSSALGKLSAHKELISRVRRAAEKAVNDAHWAWDEASKATDAERRVVALRWAEAER